MTRASSRALFLAFLSVSSDADAALTFPLSLAARVPLPTGIMAVGKSSPNASSLALLAYAASTPPIVFVAMGYNDSVAIVDASANTFVTSLSLPNVRSVAASAATGLLYVTTLGLNIGDDDQVDQAYVQAFSLTALFGGSVWRNTKIDLADMIKVVNGVLFVATLGTGASKNPPSIVLCNASRASQGKDFATIELDPMDTPGTGGPFLADFVFDRSSAQFFATQPGFSETENAGGKDIVTYGTLAVLTRGIPSTGIPPELVVRYPLPSPQRFPMGIAHSSDDSRIFLVTVAYAPTRATPTFYVLNDADGSIIFSAPIPDGCGSVFFDAPIATVYVVCGGPPGAQTPAIDTGILMAWAQITDPISGADSYVSSGSTPLPPGAVAGHFISGSTAAAPSTLYISVPAIASASGLLPLHQAAALLVYTRPGATVSPSPSPPAPTAPPAPPAPPPSSADAALSLGGAIGIAAAVSVLVGLACGVFLILLRNRRRALLAGKPVVNDYGGGGGLSPSVNTENPLGFTHAQVGGGKRWRKERDAHGRVFFISEVDGETRWELPEEDEY